MTEKQAILFIQIRVPKTKIFFYRQKEVVTGDVLILKIQVKIIKHNAELFGECFLLFYLKCYFFILYIASSLFEVS